MARRHANGQGSISQRKDGRWEAAFWSLTTSGVRKRIRLYGQTHAEAHAKLTEAKAKAQRGIPSPDKAWRLGEYLDYWLEQVVQPNRRRGTYAQCETITRLYLKPGIGQYHLTRLSVPVVQAYLNRHLADGHSAATAHVIKKVLSAALTNAERQELVSRNVARLVELPRVEAAETHPWSIEEANQFLAAAKAHVWYPAFLLLIVYGLRRGEVLGLRWQDVDFAADELHIRQQFQRVGHELFQGPLKTRAARRDLPLLGSVVDVLRHHHDHRVTPPAPDHDLVFTTSAGTPIEPRNFVRTFQQICRQHQLRIIKVHGLRHTAATMLKKLGVPAREAQLIMGHARVATTQELYQHGDMDTRRDALDRIGAVLGQAEPPQETSQAEEPGTWGDVVDGSRSHQFSRQVRDFVAFVTSIISGAGEETLTLDLFLGKSKLISPIQRATEVKELLEKRTRQRILGVVAVNVAVKQPL
ncbi:MAG TPA: site-specific integrase [Pseudonocardiaceae bacterium]|jgi:integrase|nr:site-specific integrase [Pseudonocardiaceae bacterium]